MGLAELDQFLSGSAAASPAPSGPGIAALDAFIAEKGGVSSQHPWVQVNERARTLEGAAEAAEGVRRAVRLVGQSEKPSSVDDAALVALGAMPIIKQGGAVAKAALPVIPKLAPALGRVATSVGLAKARGEDNPSAAVEGLGALGAEGVMALGSKLLASPSKAINAIRQRIGAGPQGTTNVGVFDRMLNFWQAAANPAEKAIRATGSPGRPGMPGTILGITRYLDDVDPTGVSSRLFREEVMRGTRLWPLRATLPAASPGVSRAAEAATGPTATAAADAVLSSDKKAAPAAGIGAKILLTPIARALNAVVD